MKWEIESVSHSPESPTIVVRVLVRDDDGKLVCRDQNSLPNTATEEDVRQMCDDMASKHVQLDRPDVSHLVGMKS